MIVAYMDKDNIKICRIKIGVIQ